MLLGLVVVIIIGLGVMLFWWALSERWENTVLKSQPRLKGSKEWMPPTPPGDRSAAPGWMLPKDK